MNIFSLLNSEYEGIGGMIKFIDWKYAQWCIADCYSTSPGHHNSLKDD